MFAAARYFLPLAKYPFVGHEIDCPVCGSADHEPIATLDRKLKKLTTHVCNHCGLLFHNPMPSDEELGKYYCEMYRLEHQFFRKKPRPYHIAKKGDEARRRYDQISKFVDLTRPMSTLDFGCGSGELVRHMAKMGHSASGIEPGDDFSEHAELAAFGAAKIFRGGWAEIDIPPASFDIVTCLHVLEHLNNPIAALKQIEQWLKPGGVFFVEVPNMMGYANKGFDCLHFAHTLGFSRDNLVFALRQAGFAIMNERAPTSMFAVKQGDARSRDVVVNLQKTAEDVKAGYSAPFSLSSHLRRHYKRCKRVLRDAVGASR